QRTAKRNRVSAGGNDLPLSIRSVTSRVRQSPSQHATRRLALRPKAGANERAGTTLVGLRLLSQRTKADTSWSSLARACMREDQIHARSATRSTRSIPPDDLARSIRSCYPPGAPPPALDTAPKGGSRWPEQNTGYRI